MGYYRDRYYGGRKGNVRAQKRRWRERRFGGSINNEDLSRWKPQWGVRYAGYGSDNRDGRGGKVIIHIGDDEHIGGFYIHHDGTVKIWYGAGEATHVPIESCAITKRRDGNLNIYDVFVDIKYLGVTNNDKIGGIVSDNKSSKSGYGLGDREGTPEEESVIFRVPKEKVGILGRLTGRTSAIYQKKRYEDKLNELWREFDSTIDKIKSQNTDFDKLDTAIPGFKKTLEVARDEWHESLTSLGNLLEKAKKHEWEMWQTTQKNRHIRVQKNAPRIKYSDVDEMNFNSMTDFIQKYPDIQTQKTVEKAIQSVDDKRKEIIDTQRGLDQAISERNLIVSTFEKLTQDAEDTLNTFEELIKEADEKVNNSPYNRSKLWMALKTDYEKEATKLELMPYRGELQKRKNVLKRVQGQHAKYQRRDFVDIEH